MVRLPPSNFHDHFLTLSTALDADHIRCTSEPTRTYMMVSFQSRDFFDSQLILSYYTLFSSDSELPVSAIDNAARYDSGEGDWDRRHQAENRHFRRGGSGRCRRLPPREAEHDVGTEHRTDPHQHPRGGQVSQSSQLAPHKTEDMDGHTFSISIITIMGLIGSVCRPCQDAAGAPDGGGLAGRWWRAWARVRTLPFKALAFSCFVNLNVTGHYSLQANEQSGLIGAAIVGSFLIVVCGFYGVKFLKKRWKRVRNA